MKPIATLLFLALHLSAMATIHYAKPTPSGTGDGTSWANASNDISLLLKNAVAGDEIWVAQGTYYPTLDPNGNNSYNNCFFMKNGVRLYGGFSGNGTETSLSERDYKQNISILGALNYTYYEMLGFDFPSYVTQVVVSINDGVGTGLDGFTIKNGRAIDPDVVDTDPISADGQYIDWLYGGGIHNINSSITIANCLFINNLSTKGGGAIFNRNSSPTITNCLFSGNAGGSGGAILNLQTSAPTISHCIFANNRLEYPESYYVEDGEEDLYGGAVCNGTASSATISNSVFYQNSVYGKEGSSMAIVHSTFFNSALRIDDGNTATIHNSVMNNVPERDNASVTISNSLIQGSGGSGGTWVAATGTDGGGNIDTDPLFVNTANLVGPDNIWATTDDGLALQPCSPAINTGNNADIAATDITGSNRLVGPNTDMGAYERQTVGETITLYQDLDGDGYGNPSVSIISCATPGYVPNNTDCDDTDATLNPETVWYKDADNDGYSDGSMLIQCVQPEGYRLAGDLTATSGDCNDENASIHPSATEICNGVDDNCNGTVDEGCPTMSCSSVVGRLYVNTAAIPGGNGATWLCALQELRDAVAIANANPSISEIWVAKGTYKPTAGSDRSASFAINRTSLTIAGGFLGNEASASLADPLTNRTILSGDIGVAGNHSDNSYHVIRILDEPDIANPPTGETRLTGFQIERGNANSSNPLKPEDTKGGGLLLGVNARLATVHIKTSGFASNNASTEGGAISQADETQNSTQYLLFIDSCLFYQNIAGRGGAVAKANGIYHKVLFAGNKAVSGNGGAIYSYNSGIEVSHNNQGINKCAFDNNTASGSGGAMYLENTRIDLNSSVFNNNTAGAKGGGIYVLGNITNAYSSTFYNNKSQNGGGGLYLENTQIGRIMSNIFWKNRVGSAVTGANTDIGINGGIPGFIENNMLQQGTSIPADDGNNTQENMRGVDPLFVNEAKPAGDDGFLIWQNDGLQLSAGSPAINSGKFFYTIYEDVQENPRIQCETVDRGAYEYSGCPPARQTPPLIPNEEIKARVNSLFTTSLQIHYNGPQKASLTITDLSGRPMTKTSSLPQGMTSINTSNWLGGMYQVVIYYNGKPHVFKVIKGK